MLPRSRKRSSPRFTSATSTVLCLPCSSFFFQAEDGIRDKLVTGVQTCALPISRGTNISVNFWRLAPIWQMATRPGLRLLFRKEVFSSVKWFLKRRLLKPILRRRSEERRVGKSVDLGGRRIIKKKTRTRQRETLQ